MMISNRQTPCICKIEFQISLGSSFLPFLSYVSRHPNIYISKGYSIRGFGIAEFIVDPKAPNGEHGQAIDSVKMRFHRRNPSVF